MTGPLNITGIAAKLLSKKSHSSSFKYLLLLTLSGKLIKKDERALTYFSVLFGDASLGNDSMILACKNFEKIDDQLLLPLKLNQIHLICRP